MPASPKADAATADRVIDARHLQCPLPTLRLKQAIREGAGALKICDVIATDPRTPDEIHAFAKTRGHTVVDVSVNGVEFRIRIAVGKRE